ncbi:MAG: RepB family DNA primase [Rickettsiales bacterium]|nr:RepB family DNA primase [Rickettsiales bacterium]
MNCSTYKIGIYNRDKPNMQNKHNLTCNDILKISPWLKYENCIGKDIFICQSNDIDRAIILVDDLSIDQIQVMCNRGVSPACVIETSPANFQAWVSLGPEPMPKEQRKIVAVAFAKEFNGDLASASANHYGRLAGFTNRKPKHFKNNCFPFVRYRNGTGRHAEKSYEIRAWAANQQVKAINKSIISDLSIRYQKRNHVNSSIDHIFNKYFDEFIQHNNNNDIDISLGDFAVASRMLKEGYPNKGIIEAIINNSPNIDIRKANHIENYALRTVLAAERNISKK